MQLTRDIDGIELRADSRSEFIFLADDVNRVHYLVLDITHVSPDRHTAYSACHMEIAHNMYSLSI